MISGISKVAFYNPVDGVTVQLNLIRPESVFNIREPLSVEKTDGNLLYAGDQSNVSVVASDATGFTQLETWMNAETPVRMVAAGVDSFIAWRDECPITVTKNKKVQVGDRDVFTVNMAAKGGEQNIYAGSNLLFVALGWADANSNGEVDGYTITATGSIAKSFVAGVQSIEAGAAVSDLVVKVENFEFPIAGALMNFFNNLAAKVVSTGSIKVVEKDFGGSILQTNSDSNIENTLAITTDATCYKLDIYLIDAGTLANTATQTFNSPCLGKLASGINDY